MKNYYTEYDLVGGIIATKTQKKKKKAETFYS